MHHDLLLVWVGGTCQRRISFRIDGKDNFKGHLIEGYLPSTINSPVTTKVFFIEDHLPLKFSFYIECHIQQRSSSIDGHGHPPSKKVLGCS